MSSVTRPVYLNRQSHPHISTLIALAAVSSLALNMFLPSLPNMTSYFKTDYGLMQLSVGLFLMMNGLLQIVVGPLSDRFGRRPVILGGVIIFAIASVGCALAKSIEVFLAFRMLQSVISVGLVLGRAAIRDMVGQAQAASMIGYVTMAMSVIPMIAPAIGGELDTAFGWQASFWVMAGLAAIVGVITWFDFGETSTTQSASFGAQFKQYPELFTSRRFWGYTFAMMFGAGTFFAFLGGGPFVGSEVFGLTPNVFGYYFGAPAVGYFVGNYISGRFSERVGVNTMILIGAAVMAAGLSASLILFVTGTPTPLSFFGFMCFVGLGNGMVLPNAMAGLLSVKPHLAGSASGVAGAFMTVGGAALSALAGALLGTGTGTFPLLALMVASAILSLLMIVYVIRREAQVTG